MKIISIANRKGGAGKTTLAINLSVALAQKRKRILLIDLDPQANLTYSFGIEPTATGTTANMLASKTGIDSLIVRKEDVGILPAEKQLADVELALAGKIGRESILKNRLAVVSGYDYVFIDCPPSLGLLTVNALNASDRVLIPTQMEVLSLQGLAQLFETVSEIKQVLNSTLEIMGIVPFMYDARRNLSAEVLKEIKKNAKERIFETAIRECVKIAEAPSFAQSVLAYAPGSHGAEDFATLAKEFLSIRS